MISLSIVIPTRNRYDSLFPSIEALVNNITGDDYEIVIQDNTPDNNVAAEYFGKQSHDRIKYFYCADKLSQSENSEMALSRATGEYVLFIGDDDTVSPYILRIIGYMRDHDIECLSYIAGAYLWNNVILDEEELLNKPGLLWMRSNISSIPEIKSAEKELQYVLDNGATSIVFMPRVYHGIVSNRLLQRMREANNGKYVVGSCPDMNLAVSLATCIDKYHFINYPVSINGGAPKSGSGLHAKKSHRAYLDSMVEDGWLPQSIIDKWNPMLPKVWTVPTIYAQAVYEALQVRGIDKEINYTQHYSACLWSESWARKEIFKAIKLAVAQNKTSWSAIWGIYMYRHVRRIMAKTLKPIIGRFIKKPMPLRFKDVGSIDECMKILAEIPFDPDDKSHGYGGDKIAGN